MNSFSSQRGGELGGDSQAEGPTTHTLLSHSRTGSLTSAIAAGSSLCFWHLVGVSWFNRGPRSTRVMATTAACHRFLKHRSCTSELTENPRDRDLWSQTWLLNSNLWIKTSSRVLGGPLYSARARISNFWSPVLLYSTCQPNTRTHI